MQISPARSDRAWKRSMPVGAPVYDKTVSVDLKPGETYELPVAKATDEFDFYLTESAEYEINAGFISGIRYNKEQMQRMLVDDALVMDSKPVTFRVEFE